MLWAMLGTFGDCNGRCVDGGVENDGVLGCGVEVVTAPTVAQRDLAVQLARDGGVELKAPARVNDMGEGEMREGVGVGAYAYIPRPCGSHSANATFRSAAS